MVSCGGFLRFLLRQFFYLLSCFPRGLAGLPAKRKLCLLVSILPQLGAVGKALNVEQKNWCKRAEVGCKLKVSIAYNDMNLFLVSVLYLIKLSFVASKSFTYIAICSILIITTANFIFYSCFICNSTISFILKNSFSYFG